MIGYLFVNKLGYSVGCRNEIRYEQFDCTIFCQDKNTEFRFILDNVYM